MPLGMEVDLGPDNIMLDVDPAPLHKRGTAPPIFGPCLLWPNVGWIKMLMMDGETDRHSALAYAALAQRHAVKIYSVFI